MAGNTSPVYNLPQDACDTRMIPERWQSNFIYEYTMEEEYLYSMTLPENDIKNNNILFMLLCAAAEGEDFPFNF